MKFYVLRIYYASREYCNNRIFDKIYMLFYTMDKFKYHKEWEDKCRYDIGRKKSCSDCLFDTLCLFERNQEKNSIRSWWIKKDLKKN